MSIERINALQRADDEYSLLNQRRAIASTPGGLSKKMYSKIDRPTEETIQQYNQAHQRRPEGIPLVDADGDPILDDSGKQIIKYYQFHPVEAQPDLIDPLENTDAFTRDEQEYQIDGEQIRIELVNTLFELESNLKMINRELKSLEAMRGNVDDAQALEDEIIALTADRDNTAGEIQNTELSLEEIGHLKRQIEEKNLHNGAIIQANRKVNAERLKGYQEQLNVLNSGKFNMTQEPYESDQDYKQRLITHSQIEAPSEALYDAKVYASKEIRNKLKEIIKNDTVNDLIANSLSNEQKYNIMREWGAYAKAYKEIYGDYNPTQSVSDLITFFTNPLSSATFNSLKSKGKIQVTTPQAPQAVAKAHLLTHWDSPRFEINIVDDLLMITYKDNPNKKIFFKVVYKKKIGSGPIIACWSISSNEGSFDEVRSQSLKNFLDGEFDQDTIDSLFGVEVLNVTKVSSIDIAKSIIGKYGLEPSEVAKRKTTRTLSGPETVLGWGVSNKEIPQYSTFGNISINTRKLYYDNILTIRDKNGYQLAGMVPIKVSNEFVKLIVNILEGKKITMDDIEELKSTERQLYDHLIAIGKLQKEKPHKGDETIDKLKNQFEILRGEYEAGNNNPNIKKQIKTVLYKLYHFGKIQMTEVKDFLKQL